MHPCHLDDNSLVLLGVIVSSHGLDGKVKIKSFTNVPEDIAAYGQLGDADNVRFVTILSLKIIHADLLIAELKNITSRDLAEPLRGMKLYVSRSRLPETDGNVWYYVDLMGLAVINADGEKIGTVTEVADHGAGVFLEIAGCDGRVDLLPFSRVFVPHVDIAGGHIVIMPPDDFFR